MSCSLPALASEVSCSAPVCDLSAEPADIFVFADFVLDLPWAPSDASVAVGSLEADASGLTSNPDADDVSLKVVVPMFGADLQDMS